MHCKLVKGEEDHIQDILQEQEESDSKQRSLCQYGDGEQEPYCKQGKREQDHAQTGFSSGTRSE
jgi:CDGSH-type Zn-finger protein